MAGADGPRAGLAATLPLLRHVTEPLALGGEVTGGPEPLVGAVLDAHLGPAAPRPVGPAAPLPVGAAGR
ncbi:MULTISPECIES: hypothetical protein [Streptomyces albidoflavus group]|uniref:hypothetical protein n=1 Tax=Streptomyces albidoflavus group TaxID=1477431 RepID=UPI000282F480|nr:hypothetical protein [Streptomyces sampsonii]WTC37113.1 hypothetical protein OH723_18220 [Streptomyces albidoflavus]